MKNKKIHFMSWTSAMTDSKTACGLKDDEFLMSSIFAERVDCKNCERTMAYKKYYKMYKDKQSKKMLIIISIIVAVVIILCVI